MRSIVVLLLVIGSSANAQCLPSGATLEATRAYIDCVSRQSQLDRIEQNAARNTASGPSSAAAAGAALGASIRTWTDRRKSRKELRELFDSVDALLAGRDPVESLDSSLETAINCIYDAAVLYDKPANSIMDTAEAAYQHCDSERAAVCVVFAVMAADNFADRENALDGCALIPPDVAIQAARYARR